MGRNVERFSSEVAVRSGSKRQSSRFLDNFSSLPGILGKSAS